MTQPSQPSEGLPTLGALPLGPDEPELFTDAMERIIRHLGDEPGPRLPAPAQSSASRPRPLPVSLPQRAGRHGGA